ncbi:DUF2935 domain-containing protein [Clostridium subterminale]|uniref:DUF2935 domain-containing protein n=1 Tax=Clostridium subterminale TaxID=1550 RepID=A0ABN1KL28_CLOSU
MQIGFTPKNSKLMEQADMFRMEFDKFLYDVISLSNGVVSPSVLRSGEVVTPFTLNAEMASAYYTGVDIPTSLTEAEEELMGAPPMKYDQRLEQRVRRLNEIGMELVRGLIRFKKRLLSDVLECKVFTVNYPLLIDHILREANFYLKTIQRLQNDEEIDLEREAYEQETFWNRIMAEHSKFIRGLLDPTEEELIKTANNFANEFDELLMESKNAMNKSMAIPEITDESLEATMAISKFKAQGTQGILECKVKSIIIPLLGDHTLREANHYLRLLKIFKKSM